MVPTMFWTVEAPRIVLSAETASRVTTNISDSLSNYRQLLPRNCGCLLSYLVHTHIHIYIHTQRKYTHSYIQKCMCAYIHTFEHTCLHTWIHTYIHTNMHIYIHTHIILHIHTYTAIHSSIRTYIDTLRNTWSVPKVMRVIFLRSPERPGKESGSIGRWRGNPRIQLDLPQLS